MAESVSASDLAQTPASPEALAPTPFPPSLRLEKPSESLPQAPRVRQALLAPWAPITASPSMLFHCHTDEMS